MLMNKERFSNQIFWKMLLVSVILIAAILRFYGLDWDEGFNYTPHPDERAILMKVMEISPTEDIHSFFDIDQSSLNPKWFAYGSFPLYLLKIIEGLVRGIELFTEHDIRIIARCISAIADLGTLLATYMIGRRLSGRIAGITAMSFLAVSVISIQNSHFYTVDSLLTLFITVTIYCVIEFCEKGKTRYLILAGVMIGLALGSKISALPIIFLPLVGSYVLLIRNKAKGVNLTLKEQVYPLLYCAMCAGLVLIATQPYMILDWAKYKADILEQAEIVWRIRDYPYTRQYIGTTPYLYQAVQLIKWGLGIPLGLFVIFGLVMQLIAKMKSKSIFVYVFLGIVLPSILCVNVPYPYGQVSGLICALLALIIFVHFRRGYNHSLLVVLAWVVPYLIVMGALEAKFLRYILPAIPSLIVMGSIWAVDCINRPPMNAKKVKLAAYLILAIIFCFTLIQALAFVSIYSDKHTAVRASEWINTNVKPGSILIKEHWEESIPSLSDYEIRELALYEEDTQGKINGISKKLASGDYMILFSNRLYGTIPRLPERYPLTTGYYQALFKEKLGYMLVKEATQKQYPKILGISFVNDTYSRPNLEIEDLGSNENFAVDIGYLDESLTVYDHPKILIFENKGRFQAEQIQREILKESVMKGIANEVKLSDNHELIAERTSEASSNQWKELFTDKPLQQKYPILIWGIAIVLMGLMSTPITLMLFKNLPDKGYGFSKILGMSMVGFIVWFAVSWEILQFTSTTIIISSLGVLAINILVFTFKRKEIIPLIKQNWKLLMLQEMIFAIAFIAFVILRTMNPDLWHPYRGGEKPMELAHINALTRSLYLPPYDPWYSGGILNYYYYGHFLVTNLIKICGIVPTVAFNLAVPTFFAMAVAGSFSLGFNIFSGTVSKTLNSIRDIKPKSSMNWPPVFAGLTSVIFVCLLGNLDGISQIFGGVWDQYISGISWQGFDYWQSSRMMPPDPPGFEVTEFPFFTFLFADLHSHLISIPFTLLLLATMLSLVISPTSRRGGIQMSFHELATIFTMGIVLGSVRIINAWDFPTYFFLGCFSLLLREVFAHGGIGVIVGARWLFKAAIFYFVSYIAFIPFYSNYKNFYSSVEATTNKTELNQMLMIFGIFIFIIIGYLVINARRTFAFSNIKPISLSIPKAIYIVIASMVIGYLVSGPLEKIIGGAALLLIPIIGLLCYSLVTGVSRFKNKERYTVFAMLLLSMSLAIIVGVELVRIQGDIDRMNTVFKFYLQAWILLGIGCSFLFWRCIQEIKENGKTRVNIFLFGTCCILIGFGLIYPIFGTPARIGDRFTTTKQTLDGTAYMNKSIYRDPQGEIDLSFDYKAIDWLNNNLTGVPVILEANTPMYRWGSRVSIYTGFPTVLGWRWHQEQQRMDKHSEIAKRAFDIKRIYETENIEETLELIKKYQVKYIYIGSLERLYYSDKGLNKFTLGMNGRFEKIYSNQQVEIYRVISKNS